VTAGRFCGLLAFSALLACNSASQANPPAATKVEPAKPAPSQSARVKAAPKPAASAAKPVESASPQAAASSKAASDDAAPSDMLLVPGGTFKMGSDTEGEEDEKPAHSVTLKSFWLDKTEVTNEAYRACVDAKVCRPWKDDVAKAMHYGDEKAFRGAKQPVVGVSWEDAKSYCEWRGKRLPTEAEWERAARGEDNRKYPWGNDAPDAKRHGCFQGCQGGATATVGSYPDGAGPYGHLDMAGSVWEWMADHYDPYAYKRSTASQGIPGTCEQILAAQDELRQKKLQGYTGSNPIPTECERVLRGGAFNYHAKGLRSSNRVHHPGTWRLLVAGARCAQDVKPAKS
jgi:formylglycine-generating enzyme required for sulfatase activity